MKAIFSATLGTLSFFAGIVFSAPSQPHHDKRQALAQVYSKCTVPNTVALTFDDGPFYYQYDIGKLLKDNNSTGTFFVNGLNWSCIYDNGGSMLKAVYAMGHQIGSHTWSHAHLNTLTAAQVDSEMAKVDLALKRILGISPAFMRPPYGAYSDVVLQVSGARGQSVALWDFDSGDMTGATAQQSKQAYTDVANAHPSTVLALNHETSSSTAYEVIAHAITVLKAKGYKLVSLAECLDLPAYQSIGQPETGSWTC